MRARTTSRREQFTGRRIPTLAPKSAARKVGHPMRVCPTRQKSSLSVIVALAALALCALALPASAQSRFECSAMESKLLKRAVPYCVMLPPSFDAQKTRHYPVLYYLHGLGDNEQSLVNGGGWELYEQLMRNKKIGEFLIVTPSGFRSFYVDARSGKFPYEEFFFKEFMPAIEKRYRATGTQATRGVMGVSMGGYGALRYAFAHPAVFTSVSAHMPALSEEVPTSLSSPQEQRMLQSIFGTSGGTNEKGNAIDGAYYKRISPFTAAAQAPAAELKRMAIYFDCGANDDYGFDLGSQALHKALQRRGIAHEFHIYPGRHDWSYIMQHFGASLEFHSKAFKVTPR